MRHLGVRLTNFYDGTFGNGLDGRGGPVPLNARSWVDDSIIDVNNRNKHKPYRIKWENGNDIAQITDYTLKTDKNYGQWIEDNNITTGTVVVTIHDSENTENTYNHIWFYIGKFDNMGDVKAYLKSIGVSQTIIDNIQIDTSGGTKYWSIECATNGVTITNRDPSNVVKGKGGSGYAGFTLVPTTGEYNLQISKVDEAGKALSGAIFSIDNNQTTSTQGKITKRNQTIKHTISEINAPSDKYFKLKNPETITLTSADGLKNGKYYINKAVFDNGKTTKTVQLENGDTVILKLSINSNNTAITLTVPNKKLEGKFKLNVRKIDETGNTITDATGKIHFEVKGKTEQITLGSNGEAELIGETNITEDGQTFNYEIKEIVDSTGTYVGLKKAIGIKLTSGIYRTSTGKTYYFIKEVVFDNGSRQKEVELTNGKKVKLRTHLKVLKDGLVTVTLDIPNAKKEYDLALTKSIVIPDYDEYDYNRDGKVNSRDAAFIGRISKEMYESNIPTYGGFDDVLAASLRKTIKKANFETYKKYEKMTDGELLNKFSYNDFQSYANKNNPAIRYDDLISLRENLTTYLNTLKKGYSYTNTSLCFDFNGEKDYEITVRDVEALHIFITNIENKYANPDEITEDDIEEFLNDKGDYSSNSNTLMKQYISAIFQDKMLENARELAEKLANKEISSNIAFSSECRLNSVNNSNLNLVRANGDRMTTANYNLDKRVFFTDKDSVIMYKISVYNEGDYDTNNIVVTDYIPDELVFCDIKGVEQKPGEFTVTHDDVTTTWTISESGKTASAEISGPIKAYDGGNSLDGRSVYITCKINPGSTDISEKHIYNISEITSFQGEDKKTHTDRDSQPGNITDTNYAGNTDPVGTYKEKVNGKYNLNRVYKERYEYEDDDDFEVITESDSRGEYSVHLIKKGTDETQLGGVKFTAKRKVNGASTSEQIATEENPIETSKTEAVPVVGSVPITATETDTYEIKEVSIGQNENYKEITGIIQLEISKRIDTVPPYTDSLTGETISGYKYGEVTAISLSYKVTDPSDETWEKNNASDTEQSLTITLDDGQKATVSAKLDKDTGLIVLTVENVEGTTYEVEKIWRPTEDSATNTKSIEVQLYANTGENGQEVAYGDKVALNSRNDYYYKWTSLPKYKTGTTDLIKYSVKEIGEVDGISQHMKQIQILIKQQ